MTSQIDKSPNTIWKGKEANMSNITSLKSVKILKSPKKFEFQECKNSVNDKKVEDVFLGSEYFKHQTGNISSLSFCSGDTGENQWKIDRGFEFPQKTIRRDSYSSEAIKSDKAVPEKGKLSRTWQQKLKIQNCNASEVPQEKTNKLLEGILAGKGRLDRDLITLITEQMFLAERELQVTRTHLIETVSKLNERDLEILQLHEKIENLQLRNKTDVGTKKNKQTESSPTKTSEDYHRLILASEKLKKQVKDMEDFLNDYGLIWVGDVTSQKPDFDKVLQSFLRLNSIASEPKIIHTTMGAKFEVPHEIPVVLYSNGLLLRNKNFRPYDDMSTSLFLKDVEDGYFPSELQSEFPEGVPFAVTDKRNEVYTPNNKLRIFQGHGNRLGSMNERKPSSIVYFEPLKKIRNHDSHSSLGLDSTDRYLLKKIHKKRTINAFSEEDSVTFQMHTTECQQSPMDSPERETEHEQHLKVKIRFGMEKMESFVLQVAENDKMFSFQEALQRKLCERYNDECVKTSEMNNGNPDLEIHIYGRSPFRLSDYLNQYPVECGIVNNCVINVTEI